MSNRDHPDVSERAPAPEHGSAARPTPPAAGFNLAALGPTWRLLGEYWGMVRRHVPARTERLRCYACLVGWLLVNRNGVRLLLELVSALNPRVRAVTGKLRDRVSGTAPLASVARQRLGHH